MDAKRKFRNVWSGATFVVVGDEAAGRIAALSSWVEEKA